MPIAEQTIPPPQLINHACGHGRAQQGRQPSGVVDGDAQRVGRRVCRLWLGGGGPRDADVLGFEVAVPDLLATVAVVVGVTLDEVGEERVAGNAGGWIGEGIDELDVR